MKIILVLYGEWRGEKWVWNLLGSYFSLSKIGKFWIRVMVNENERRDIKNLDFVIFCGLLKVEDEWD